MNKQLFVKIAFILFPVLAVGLATTGDSVMVLDTVAQTVEHHSYFELIPQLSVQIILPMAALLCVAAGLLGAVYIATGKGWCKTVILWISFCAAMLAVAPVLLRGEVMVVPNVGVPLFMVANWGVAVYARKLEEQPVVREARKLKNRK